MTSKLLMTEHAILRYAERVLGMKPPERIAYDDIADEIRREIAQATPLSPMERAIFADQRYGVNPKDEFFIHGNTVFVLTRSRSDSTMRCITIYIATPEQLVTIADISTQEDAAHATRTAEHTTAIHWKEARARTLHVFLETLITHFGITSAYKHGELYDLFTKTPRCPKNMRPKRSEMSRIVGKWITEDMLIAFWDHWQQERQKDKKQTT